MLPALDQIWRFALAAIPLAIVVGLLCRWLPCRPTTRHMLWLSVIVFLVVAPFLPSAPAPDLITAAGVATVSPDPREPTGAPRSSTPRAAALDSTEPSARPRSPVAAGASRAIRRFDHAGSTDVPPAVDSRSVPSRERVVQTPRRLRPPTPTRVHEPARVTPPPASPRIPAATAHAGPAPDRSSPVASPAPQIAASGSTDASLGDAWVTGLARLRDAVLALPALPAAVWGGGAMMLMITVLMRTLFFLRTVRAAEPAPEAVTRMVHAAAADLALRRVPTARMISRRMSPMVFCGRAPVLLLPRDLWRELDDTGRRAVVCHELAHVKRRDHWFCWIDLLVGCLYWWHPLVWWIRRRLNEEADLCCDAWVTALQPTARRAYATALLTTQRFTSECPRPAPAVQLGSPRTHAKKFARRLTMVMTQHNSPRHSIVGVTLAALIVGAGWMVSPTLACPPSKDEAKHKASRAKAPRPKLRLVVPPTAPTPPTPFTAPSAPTAPRAPESTFERYMRDRPNQQHRGDASIEERLGELESHIEMLMHQLMQWLERFEDEMPELAEQFGRWAEKFEMPDIDFGQFGEMMRQHGHAAEEHAHAAEEHAHAREHAHEMAKEAREHAHEMAKEAREHAREDAKRAREQVREQRERREEARDRERERPSTRRAPGLSGGGRGGAGGGCGGGAGGAGGAGASDATVIRAYELPEGKLAALTELMVRADVPILVSPGESRIEVHATPSQHAIFGLFCAIIDQDDEDEQQVGYTLPSGKLEAITELMVRDDVPVLVSPGDERITVIGNSVEQQIFRAFVEMINPGNADRRPSSDAGPSRSRAEAYERAATEELAAVRSLEQSLRSVSAQSRKSEREAEQLRARIEKLLEAASEMDAEADALDDEAAGRSGQRAERAHARANELRTKADKMRADADSIGRKIGSVKQSLDSLHDVAADLEQRLASLQEGTGRRR